MRQVSFVVTMLAVLIALPADGAKIEGKIQFTKEFKERIAAGEDKHEGAATSAYYWRLPNALVGVLPPAVDFASDVGVAIFSEGADEPEADEIQTVKVYAGSLERSVILVRPGSTIKLRNVDPFDHELYSPGQIWFSAERQTNGSFRPIEFAEEGVYEVRCKLFPDFLAHVVVTKATLVVQLGHDGNLKLEELPTGGHVIKVFYGGRWVHTEKLRVKDTKSMSVQVKVTGEAVEEAGAEQREATEAKKR